MITVLEELLPILAHLNANSMNYIHIECDKADIYIESRPHYCDRGRFIVKVDSKAIECNIDEQDGYPRYYYNCFAMATEIDGFCLAKKLTIKSINDKGIENDGT
ncbi:hypothetical protein AQUSIP_12540 [Aquicella siphonis]|uniref:Uncharacterized protein n=1 Tax=Aquicella siphonis TaxID=254247 RepID=A0A5E4PHU8_9COXI|nr:hypothetical protein [Aquicella siphonis]VVC75953.1 hypothetical protein AQUSIP_12540 [Aquicella siphonis]